MKYLFFSLVFLGVGISLYPDYPHRIGFIPKNKAININPDFKVCNNQFVVDYYNRSGNNTNDVPAGYIGGPKAIKKRIAKQYPDLDLKNESGMLTIRFIINCKAEIGRFEILENDLNYQPKQFDPEVKEQLFNFTKDLKNWRANYLMDEYRDCAMYLTYKLKNGEIIAILP